MQHPKRIQPPNRIYARTPWHLKDDYLPFLCSQGINAEFYLTKQSFEQINGPELTSLHETLTRHNLDCTVHAPTEGFDPGSTDPAVQESTRHLLLSTLRLSRFLKARSIVVHSGYQGEYHAAATEPWIQRSIDFWTSLLPQINAADALITLENLYEQNPSIARSILERVRSLRLRHCFDCGHHNMYATVSLEAWFSELGRYCTACHLHDNNGSSDEHAVPGKGTIDFNRLVGLLYRHAPAASWTLEARSFEQLQLFCERLELDGVVWRFRP